MNSQIENRKKPKLKKLLPMYLTLVAMLLPAFVFFTALMKDFGNIFSISLVTSYVVIVVFIHFYGHLIDLFLRKIHTPSLIRFLLVLLSFPLFLIALTFIASAFVNKEGDYNLAKLFLMVLFAPIGGTSILFHLWVTLPSPLHCLAGALWKYTSSNRAFGVRELLSFRPSRTLFIILVVGIVLSSVVVFESINKIGRKSSPYICKNSLLDVKKNYFSKNERGSIKDNSYSISFNCTNSEGTICSFDNSKLYFPEKLSKDISKSLNLYDARRTVRYYVKCEIYQQDLKKCEYYTLVRAQRSTSLPLSIKKCFIRDLFRF